MPQKCKDTFVKSIESGERSIADFKVGLKLEGKLRPKRIRGGILLVDCDYEMR